MTRHVVVTGAGGFVGGFVADWLVRQGADVTAVLHTLPERTAVPVAGLQWRKADLLEPGTLPPQFDALVHCAALLPSRSSDPDLVYRSNVTMAEIFEQAIAAGARVIINLSSMSVYGAITVPVVTEALMPTDADAYGRAKRDAELLLADRCQSHAIAGLSIRLPGTVGKGSHHNFLSDCLTRMRAGETLTAFNPDAPFNNIVHVRDLRGSSPTGSIIR